MGIASALTITPAMAAGINKEIFAVIQIYSPGGDDTPQFLDKEHSVFVFSHVALIAFSFEAFRWKERCPMRVSAFLGIAAALVATSVTAQAPDASFKQLLSHGGTRLAAYISASRCGNASHRDATLVADLDSGKVVDTSYQQPSINCCGGPGNKNVAKTKGPAGIYVEPEFNGDGQCGVFNLRIAEKVMEKGRQKFVRVTVVANLYCGPSCAGVDGGKNCQLYLLAWVKQKPAPAETAGNKK